MTLTFFAKQRRFKRSIPASSFPFWPIKKPLSKHEMTLEMTSALTLFFTAKACHIQSANPTKILLLTSSLVNLNICHLQPLAAGFNQLSYSYSNVSAFKVQPLFSSSLTLSIAKS
jgi:hypothetical protein